MLTSTQSRLCGLMHREVPGWLHFSIRAGARVGEVVEAVSPVAIFKRRFMSKRIRTKKQAAELRPFAVERARHSKYREGGIIFYKGITWGNCLIYRIYDTKPYKTAILWGREGKGGMFSGVLSEAADKK